MAGLRALLARATAKVRAPSGPRTTTEIAGWRALIASTARRFRPTADARQVGDAAGGPVPAAASRRPKIKTKEELKYQELQPKETKDKFKGKQTPSSKSPVIKEKLLSKSNSQSSPSKVKEHLTEMKAKAPTTRPPSTFENFVANVEHNANLALRLSKALRDAGRALTNAMHAASAVVLGSSLFLYHKDRICENYDRLKHLFPDSATTTTSAPPVPATATPSAVATPPAAKPSS